MQPIFMIVQFVLGVSVVLFLIWPLLDSFGRTYDRSAEDDEAVEKRMVIDALADIEYEHETGKINDDDYERLRDHYLQQAADVFDDEELEEAPVEDSSTTSGSLEDRIEQERKRLS